jgi:two-component system cell cycle response regulator
MQTFERNIPLKKEVADSPYKQDSVLIVDDDIKLLDVFKSALKSEGHPCKTATSAMSALELINEFVFDIMITDIKLPDIDGLELTTKVKRLKPGMIVIVMTGFIEDFDYDEAIEAGASDFIKKPFTLKELMVRIKQIRIQEELLRRERELRKKVKELEEFYDMAVGRELRIKELKEEIESLKEKLEGVHPFN